MGVPVDLFPAEVEALGLLPDGPALRGIEAAQVTVSADRNQFPVFQHEVLRRIAEMFQQGVVVVRIVIADYVAVLIARFGIENLPDLLQRGIGAIIQNLPVACGGVCVTLIAEVYEQLGTDGKPGYLFAGHDRTHHGIVGLCQQFLLNGIDIQPDVLIQDAVVQNISLPVFRRDQERRTVIFGQIRRCLPALKEHGIGIILRDERHRPGQKKDE